MAEQGERSLNLCQHPFFIGSKRWERNGATIVRSEGKDLAKR
jgi:hypothetical protein